MQRNNSSLKSARTICDGESFENLKALTGGMRDSGNALWKWREGLAAAIVAFFIYPATQVALGHGDEPSWPYPTILLKTENSGSFSTPSTLAGMGILKSSQHSAL